MSKKNFSFAVMSGGEGRRFGSDKTKALLSGKPLFLHTLETGISVSSDVMLISRNPLKYEPFLPGVKYISDDYPNQCALAGMITAANHALYDKIFILSADAPLFSRELILYMADLFSGYDAVIPDIYGKTYNLSSFYSKSMLLGMKEFYEKGNYKLMQCIKGYNVLFINENDIPSSYHIKSSFLNINTVQDLELAENFILSKK